MMTGCPRLTDIPWPTRRAVTSAPPLISFASTRIGLVGYSWARTGCVANPTAQIMGIKDKLFAATAFNMIFSS